MQPLSTTEDIISPLVGVPVHIQFLGPKLQYNQGVITKFSDDLVSISVGTLVEVSFSKLASGRYDHQQSNTTVFVVSKRVIVIPLAHCMFSTMQEAYDLVYEGETVVVHSKCGKYCMRYTGVCG